MRRYTPVDFTRVTLTGDFWRERLETVLTRTIPSQYAKLESEGLLESLVPTDPPAPLRIPRRANGFTTQIFWDSDIGKWIEAASYALRHRRDATIEAEIDDIVDKLEKAQLPDGYLNLWYIARDLRHRWTNLRDNHELYNCGHLLEGAIAYFQATGRRKLLDVMERYLDHIRATFGPGPGQKRGYPGHQEIEIALIKLYHLTGERKQLDLAAYFIDERGRQPHYFDIERDARGEPPGPVRPGHLRIQPVAPAGPRADQGRRPRGPRDVHVHRHGRPRRRPRRRRRCSAPARRSGTTSPRRGCT